MAVELRCPDCRAKLRLPEAPDAGTEVECPKCATVFAAPEPEDTGEEEVIKKKKKPARDDEGDDSDRGEKKEKKKTKTKTKIDPNVPRKRKAKKRETSKALLFGVVGLGLLLLGGVGGMLVWFVARTPKSVEMMYYLPEDCDTAEGLNLGHAQKYPELYKSISGTFQNTEFKAAIDAFARVLGTSDGDALVEYVVFGSSNKSGSATVVRTRMDIDGTALGKLPGAQQKTLGSGTYYLVDGFKGGAKVRVFSPTSRLIAYCSTDVPEGVFQKMLGGHADSKEKTVGVRAGELGKRVTKGTFWSMTLYQGENKPPAASAGGAQGGNNDDGNAQFARLVADTLAGSKGWGWKASIGSREIRFEITVWYNEGDKASNTSKKFKESDLGKGDEGTPPKWWKEKIDSLGKKIGAQMLSNVGCGSSGDLFFAKSAVDTVDLKDAVSSVAGKVTGKSGGMGGPPGGPGGPPGGPGGPPGGPPVGPPGGPGAPGRPPKTRRRAWVRR
ncbi:hypothetical protein J8F10_27745 [Gemmata sp. G18]|uniref:Zinc finger/thioredoxin putative domain-containing protein n=1 Tax=Gemmata palustris TaxID=2822762 RepID=A0ABS5BZI3_9BACT|nr:hypothetical protein [Gemmata palustris]MBP3959055.1 hypothetical protein [Gemmata palustris]